MKKLGRLYRHKRIAKKIKGDSERPRLVVFRSSKHIYVQLIDDEVQKVLTDYSTLSKGFLGSKTSNKEGAKEVGKGIAAKALALGVKKVSFDRAGYKYHGRVKSLVEGAREGGLKL